MPFTPPALAPAPFDLPDWKPVQAAAPALFAAITAVLFRHDPMNINFEINTDEYDPEAGTILPRLADCHSEAEVCRVVHEEFRRWFGCVGDRAEYAPIARAIWELLQKPVGRSRRERRIDQRCGRRDPRHNAVAALVPSAGRITKTAALGTSASTSQRAATL